MNLHQVTPPRAKYNPADGSITIEDGHNRHHFPNPDTARLWYAACVIAINDADPTTNKKKRATS